MQFVPAPFHVPPALRQLACVWMLQDPATQHAPVGVAVVVVVVIVVVVVVVVVVVAEHGLLAQVAPATQLYGVGENACPAAVHQSCSVSFAQKPSPQQHRPRVGDAVVVGMHGLAPMQLPPGIKLPETC